MIGIVKRLLGFSPPVDYTQLINEGAIIVDVRSRAEFMGGHIKGSQNIPLNSLGTSLNQIKNKKKPIITCCASGMRSASAKNLLKAYGYDQVVNGGGWRSLQNKLDK